MMEAQTNDAMAEVSRGEEFEALVRRNRKQIYSQAYRLLHDATEAEDATQEALLRAWCHYPHFDAARLPQPAAAHAWNCWLHRIVTNVAFNRLRDLKRSRRHLLDVEADASSSDSPLSRIPSDPAAEPERQVMVRELSKEVETLMKALPEEQATILRLHAFEGCSYEEIAAITHRPLGTIRSRLHRARARLSAGLRQSGFLDPRRVITGCIGGPTDQRIGGKEETVRHA
jgi:RNA polymerase sigma-70 factor, ECF subfamily